MKTQFILFVFICLSIVTNAQDTRIQTDKACINCGNVDAEPHASAVLEIESTTKGMLIPRMTTFQKLDMPTAPANGLLVFDTTTDSFWYYKSGTGWIELSSGASFIADADDDTKIQAEENTDEDKIRFDIGGTEHWIMDGARLESVNAGGSILIGEGAGMDLDVSSNFGSNIAIGEDAMRKQKDGFSNIAIGSRALELDTLGNSNIAIGDDALAFHNGAFGNIAIGPTALKLDSVGFRNVAIGEAAMGTNKKGYSNVAIGFDALFGNYDGVNNVAIGGEALKVNNNGDDNTAIGDLALFSNDGHGNVAIGKDVAITSERSDSMTLVGAFADLSLDSLHNVGAFGANTVVNDHNKIRIGNTLITKIEGQVNFMAVSDGRFKYDVEENVPGLEFINMLRPVTYHFDISAFNKHIQPDNRKNQKPTHSNNNNVKRNNILHTGFIAQEVEAAAESIGYDFHGVAKPTNPKDNYGLRYAEFTVPLVKAVQEISMNEEELKIENEKLKKELEQIKHENELLENKVKSVEDDLEDIKIMIAQLQGCCVEKEKAPTSSKHIDLQSTDNQQIAYLEQNTPNPFHEQTIIRYFLPQEFKNAAMRFANLNGQILKTIPLRDSGLGTVSISAKELPAGTYHYTLILDDKIIDTKKMILTR